MVCQPSPLLCEGHVWCYVLVLLRWRAGFGVGLMRGLGALSAIQNIKNGRIAHMHFPPWRGIVTLRAANFFHPSTPRYRHGGGPRCVGRPFPHPGSFHESLTGALFCDGGI